MDTQIGDGLDEDQPSTSRLDTSTSISFENYTPSVVREAGLEVVDQLIAKVDHELSVVNQKLKNIETERWREENRSLIDQSKFPITTFLPPYFRNNKGYAPPLNEEARLKRQHATFDPLIKQLKLWLPKEVQMLKDAVRNEMIDLQLKEYYLQVERLNEKLKASGVETSKEEKAKWTVAKEKLLGIIEYIKTNGSTMPVDVNRVNWNRISQLTFKLTRSALECRLRWINDDDPNINTTEWSNDEVQQLHNLTEGKQGFINWSLVAQQLGTRRRPFAVFQKYQEEFAHKTSRAWTREEDEKLMGIIEMVRFGPKVPWDKVVPFMVGRSAREIKIRARALDPSRRHGRWTEDEDLLLLCAVEKHGTKAWQRVKNLVPGRSDTQCKIRWRHQLSIAHDPAAQINTWTLEEDEKLLAGVQIFGRGRWRAINDTMLPRRSAWKIRTRYLSLVTTKLRLAESRIDLVRTNQQILAVRAVTELEKKNRLFDKFNEMTGADDEVIDSIRNQGSKDIEQMKRKFTVLITEDERMMAAMRLKEIEDMYKRVDGEMTEEESTQAAIRLLDSIIIEDCDRQIMEDRLERGRRHFSGPRTDYLTSLNMDLQTQKIRAATRFKRPLKLPPHEQPIDLLDSTPTPEGIYEGLMNSIGQRIRVADYYNFHLFITHSQKLKTAMKVRYEQVIRESLASSSADGPLVPPNFGTLVLQHKMMTSLPMLQSGASLYFKPALPLHRTPAIENRVRIKLSQQIVESPEYQELKNKMRRLLLEAFRLHTALWTEEAEKKWLELGEARENEEADAENANTLDTDESPTETDLSASNENLVKSQASVSSFDVDRETTLHRNRVDNLLNNLLDSASDDQPTRAPLVSAEQRSPNITRHLGANSSQASLDSKESNTLNGLFSPSRAPRASEKRIPPPAPSPLNRPPVKKKRLL